MNFIEACKIVVRECPDGYAKTYAKAGLNLDREYGQDQLEQAQRVQALYILTNMTKWRSPNATRVRVFLKDFVEPKKIASGTWKL